MSTNNIIHQFMQDYIVKSSIVSKLAQKATHIDTFTSRNIKARIWTLYSFFYTYTTVNVSHNERDEKSMFLRPSFPPWGLGREHARGGARLRALVANDNDDYIEIHKR